MISLGMTRGDDKIFKSEKQETALLTEIRSNLEYLLRKITNHIVHHNMSATKRTPMVKSLSRIFISKFYIY